MKRIRSSSIDNPDNANNNRYNYYYLEVMKTDAHIIDFIILFLEKELLIVERWHSVVRTMHIDGEEMYELSDKLPVIYIRQRVYCWTKKNKIYNTRWYIAWHTRHFYRHLFHHRLTYKVLFSTNECYVDMNMSVSLIVIRNGENAHVEVKDRKGMSDEIKKCDDIMGGVLNLIRSKCFLPQDGKSLNCVTRYSWVWNANSEDDGGRSGEDREDDGSEKRIVWRPSKWTKDLGLLADEEQLKEIDF